MSAVQLKPENISAKEKPFEQHWISRYSIHLLTGILLLTFLLYANSLNNKFTNWDDTKYITQNELIKDISPQGIQRMFSTFYAGNYHPLVALSNGIEYSFFKLNPKPYHTFNLLLHMANTVLVFFFAAGLTKKKGLALFTALFFAIHPMHVESVAWVSERKDVLYSLFFLASLLAYQKYQENDFRLKYFLVCLVLFLLSLLSKSAAVTLPLVLLAIDYYRNRKFTVKTLTEKVPFFILSFIFGYIAFISQSEAINGSFVDKQTTYAWFEHLFLAAYALLFYVIKLLLPVNLSALYLLPEKADGLLPWEYYAAPIGIALILWAITKTIQLKKKLIFGTLFYFFTILLVLQLLPVGQAIVSERYSYLPYIGLLMIIGWVGQSFVIQSDKGLKNLQPLLLLLVIFYTVFFSFLTVRRTKVWKNSVTLFSDIIKKNPETKIAYMNRGAELLEIGDFRRAYMDFSKVAQLAPEYPKAYFNLGVAAGNLGNGDQAILHYDQAIRLKPDYIEAHYNKGLVLAGTGNNEKAMECFKKAADLAPSNTEALYNYATLKMATGDFETSITYYSRAISYRPDYRNAIRNRGKARLKLNDSRGACEDFRNAASKGDSEAEQLLENCK